MQNKKPKILLVCSAGGHLLQMHSLQAPVWSKYDYHWVCLKKANATTLLKGEPVTWGYSPTTRNIPNLIRNFFLCLRVLWRERPTMIVSTGAGLAIPFFVIGRLLGMKTVYIESFARKYNLSLTGKGMYHTPAAQHFIVQSESLAAKYPRAVYRGTIY